MILRLLLAGVLLAPAGCAGVSQRGDPSVERFYCSKGFVLCVHRDRPEIESAQATPKLWHEVVDDGK